MSAVSGKSVALGSRRIYQKGIYECDAEEVALCSLVSHIKPDLGAIIRTGLATIYLDKAFSIF